MNDRQRNLGLSAIGGLGAGAGVYAGLGSRAAELAYLRRLPEYQVPAVAQLSRGIGWGSGEGRMTGNFVNLAHNAGVRSFFVNPSYSGLENLYEISSKTLSPRDIAELASKDFKPVGRSIAGVPDTVWDRLLKSVSGKGGTSKQKFLRQLSRGKFDGFRFGELTDNITLLGKDVLSGKLEMRPWSSTNLGNHKAVFSGERGMNYNSIPHGAGTVLPENVLDRTELWRGGPRNLARDVGWVDNYSARTGKLIPASQMDTSIWNRSNFLSRFKHRIDRRRLEKFISEHGGNASGKKIIFLSGGSVGPMAQEKLKMTLDALERQGIKDVHILAQVGGGTLSGTSNINPASAAEFFKSLPKDKVTAVEYAPMKLIRRLYNGADVNLGYGGSSSLSEILGGRTPFAFMRDSALNDQNISFASRKFNAVGIDSKAYGVARRLREYLQSNPSASLDQASRAVRGTFLAQDSASPIVDSILQRLGPSAASRESAMKGLDQIMGHETANFGTTLKTLLNPTLRNSKANAQRVKNVLKLQRARNAEVGKLSGEVLRHLSGVQSIPLKFKLPAAAAAAGLAGFGLHHLLNRNKLNS